MRSWTLVVSISLLGLHFNSKDAFGFHFGVIFSPNSQKYSSKTQHTIGPQAAKTHPITLIDISGAKGSKRKRSKRRLWMVRLHLYRRRHGWSTTRSNVPKHWLQSIPLNMAEVDPWGVEVEQSHLHLLSWALTSESETRHLAAMKIILEPDLEELSEKTVTTMDGRTINVVKAFPDVYGDLRILRFLRKDKIQDPVTAAVRYRQFLNWRKKNNVDQIRLHLEERLRLGDEDAFRPPAAWKIVDDCLPFHLFATSAQDATVPVDIQLDQWDIQKLTKIVRDGSEDGLSLKEVLGYWIYIFEALNFHLYHESVRTKQMVFADIHCNMKELNLGQLHHLLMSSILKPLINIAQSQYPETTKAIHVSCPSKLFSFVWTVLSPIVKKGTLAKVLIATESNQRLSDFTTHTMGRLDHHRPTFLLE